MVPSQTQIYDEDTIELPAVLRAFACSEISVMVALSGMDDKSNFQYTFVIAPLPFTQFALDSEEEVADVYPLLAENPDAQLLTTVLFSSMDEGYLVIVYS